MNKSVVKYLLIAAVLISAIGISVWLQQMQKPTVPVALQTIGGDFRLESDSGPLSLSDFRGKTTLVFFGYTHCPDVCPMALGVMADAMRQAGESVADRVAGIFISVDPQRDTPALLGQYAAFFDKRIKGVTGTHAQLEKIAKEWRVDYHLPEDTSDNNYAVEHSNFIYLVNQDGKVVDLFDEETNPALIADRMRPWLR
jgi:protein SCO1